MKSLISSVNSYSTLIGLDRATKELSDITIVGMNPSSKASSKGNTFPRLNSWVESLGIKEYFFVNACSKTGKVRQSDVDLDNLLKACYNAKVIALGNFASEALDKAGIRHFKLPHPSPLNRQINDKAYIEQQLTQCRAFLDYK